MRTRLLWITFLVVAACVPAALAGGASPDAKHAAAPARADQQDLERRVRRSSGTARAASRTAFANQGARAAARTLTGTFRGVLDAKRGARIKRRLGARSARVEVRGQTAIAATSGPRDARPAVIRSELAGAAELDGTGVALSPLAGRAVRGARQGAGMFWAGVQLDTDAAAKPIPGGVETFVQLRSARSPERLEMPLELPRSAFLRESRAGFEVIRDGRAIARVGAVLAVDADGMPVRVSTEAGPTGLRVSVDHRGRDVRYPILVDPTLTSIPRGTGPSWTWTTDLYGADSWYTTTGGLGIWAQGEQIFWYEPYPGGEWSATAPGDSKITRVDFTGAYVGTTACAWWGIYQKSTGAGLGGANHCQLGYAQDITVTNTSTTAGPHKAVFWGYVWQGAGATTSIAAATVYYSDTVKPTAAGFTGVPAGWTTGTQTYTLAGTDAGVGVKRHDVKRADGVLVTSKANACTGEIGDFCPGSWSAAVAATDLPEGANALSATSVDLGGLVSDARTATIRIDRTPPQLALSGPLVDNPGAGGATTVRAAAQDGTTPVSSSAAETLKARSGVKSVELLVNGAPVDATMLGVQKVEQSCAAGSCALDRTLDFDPSSLAEGSYQVTVRAIDQLGQATTSAAIPVSVDATAPSVTLSGALATAGTAELQPGDYDLTIQASDAGSGVESVEVLVDGRLDDTVQQSCAAGGCSLGYVYTFTGDAVTPGAHEVEVVTKDKKGNRTSKKIPATGAKKNSPAARAVGFEEWFQMRQVPTGAGSIAAVNLASGNLLWHHRPISNVGRGLSTNVDLTYNSLSSELDLGHGYEEVGEGFSLAVSSLTRVNEAMDVRDADRGGVITLTDADGTMHRFTRNPGGWFDPPAGVNLWLRKYHAAPATDDQRKKVWAATRPDGVTYFFDRCGYQRSVEDRNGNVLRFDYDTAPAQTESDCHPQTQSAARPKLLKVVDPAGVDDPALAPERSLTFEYEPSAAVGHSKRITRITDHAGRRLEFTYYTQQTRLQSITEAAGTTEARTFTFAYETTGGDRDITSVKDPLGRTTSITYTDDGSQGGAPKFGLGERAATITDRLSKITRFSYASAAPYIDATVTDRRAKVWQYRTDDQFRPVRSIDPAGTVTTFGWDGDNNLADVVEAQGTTDQAATHMTWNANGRITSATDANANTTQWVYRDGPGTMLSPAGVDAGKTFVSDLLKETAPLGVRSAAVDDHATLYAVDPNGDVRSRTDEEGFRTFWDYTARGIVSEQRQETDRNRFARTTFSSFDPNGLPQLIVDARGNDTADTTDGRWRVRYDKVGNTTDVMDPRGTGDPSAAVAREPYTVERSFDALDRTTLERLPKLSASGSFTETRTSYDRNDNPTATVDGNNQRTDRTFTAMDDLSLVRAPATPHEGEGTAAREDTVLRYDAEQNLVEQELPNGAATATAGDFTTAWTYDDVGRRTVERRQSRGAVVKDLITSWAYDRRGNVVGVADPRRNATGGDPALNARTAAKQRWAYRFDAGDRLQDATEDPSGKALLTDYGYDANDNLVSVVDPRGKLEPARFTTTYGYDERGIQTDATDPKGRRTHRETRGDGLLVSLTTPRGTASPLAGDFTTTFTYDAMGDLVSRSVPWADQQYGSRDWKTVYDRDQVGNPRTITDPRGRPFTNTFFDTGELRTTTRPSFWTFDGETVRERGEGDGAPATAARQPQDPRDAKGDFGTVRPEELPDLLPAAGETTFAYDGEMRLTTVTDVAGKAQSLERDAVGRVLAHTGPLGPAPGSAVDRTIRNAFAYDRNGNLRRATDGESQPMTYEYDQFDRVVAETRPGTSTGPETTRVTYDENDNAIHRVTPRLTEFKAAYDGLDRLTSREDGERRVTTLDYDAAGNLVYTLPPRGQGQTDSERYAEFRTYDEAGQLTLVEAGRNVPGGARETRYEYDADGNPEKVTAPGSKRTATGALELRVTRQVYDARGLLWTQTTGTGAHERTTATEYDAGGNLRRTVNPAGVDRASERPRNPDPGGEPTATSLWNEHSTVFAYSDDELLITTHLPWGRRAIGGSAAKDGERWQQRVQRDARGRVQIVFAPHQPGTTPRKSTTYEHFDNGWIRTSTDSGPDPHKLLYDYDRTGNQVLWSSEGKSRQIRRSFFPNGLLRERSAEKTGDPTRTYTYGYSPNGSLSQMTDDRGTPATPADDRVTVYEYDGNERQTRANETWTQSRDTKVTYDANGNVATRQTDGRFDGTAYQGGKTTAFTYDPQDREIRMQVDPAGEAATRVNQTTWFPSDDRDQRTRSRPGGADVIERWLYADDGRLLHRTRTPQSSAAASTFDYEYDDAFNDSTDPAKWGNGLRSKDEKGSSDFNSRGHLVRWTSKSAPSFPVTFEVNGAGAIEQRRFDTQVRTYLYEGERLACTVESALAQTTRCTDVTSGKTDYSYNVFSNVTGIDAPGTDGDRAYGFDGFERMTSAKRGDRQTTSEYQYDGLDRREVRIQKQAGQPDKRFDLAYVGTTELLAREEAPGGVVRSYDYDSSLQRLGQATKTGTAATRYRAYSIDANGSVEGLEQDDGSLTGNSYDYGPYGDARSNPTAGSDAESNPFRFQNHYYDDDADGYDMQARTYSPAVGRFLSPDRYESATADLALQLDPMTNDRYVFGGADPINMIEIDGHCARAGDNGPCLPLGRAQTPRERRRTNQIVSAQNRARIRGEQTIADEMNDAVNKVATSPRHAAILRGSIDYGTAVEINEMSAAERRRMIERAQLQKQLEAAEEAASKQGRPGYWDYFKLFNTPDLSDPSGVLLELCRPCKLTKFRKLRKAGSHWDEAPFRRGDLIEDDLGRNLSHTYPTIDKINRATGEVTSIKSLDLTAKTYQNPARLSKRLQGYVDKVAKYNGTLNRKPVITKGDIRSRTLELAVEPGASSLRQEFEIFKAKRYARGQGVKLTVRRVP